MTNFEYIKCFSAQELAYFLSGLCDFITEEDCLKWLRLEHENSSIE